MLISSPNNRETALKISNRHTYREVQAERDAQCHAQLGQLHPPGPWPTPSASQQP